MKAKTGLNMNPILKRFLKGLVACVLSYGIKFALENIGILVPDPALIPIFTALLLALEKSLPKNL